VLENVLADNTIYLSGLFHFRAMLSNEAHVKVKTLRQPLNRIT